MKGFTALFQLSINGELLNESPTLDNIAGQLFLQAAYHSTLDGITIDAKRYGGH